MNANDVDEAQSRPHPISRPRAASWFRASAAGLRQLLRPGRPPAGWAKLAALLVAGAILICVLLVLAGRAFHNDAARYFGERHLGTIIPAAALIATGVISLKLSRRLKPDRFARFWLWLGVLFTFAGIDDLFRLHEQLDRLIHRLLGLDPTDPVTNHLDDLIVALYALPAMLLGVRHLPRLLRLRWTVLTLAAAFACFTTMVILDVREGSRSLEESFKVVAAVLIFTAILAAGRDPGLADVSTPDERD